MRTRTNFLPKGFALLEVLIAMLILVFGVIGGAGLQLGALRTVKQSALHSTAMGLASDIADSMRANNARIATGVADPYLQIDVKSTDILSPPAVSCLTVSCTAVQLAASEIYDWSLRLQKALPDGRATICRDSTPYADGALAWTCSGAGPVVVKMGWMGKSATGKLENDAGKSTGIGPPKIALLLGLSGQP